MEKHSFLRRNPQIAEVIRKLDTCKTGLVTGL